MLRFVVLGITTVLILKSELQFDIAGKTRHNVLFSLECIGCGAEFPADYPNYTCEKCGDLLTVIYDYDVIRRKLDTSNWQQRPLSVWKYREMLPLGDMAKIITLGEGGTTLHECSNLGKKLGVGKLYVKNEGENPSGSFKDRGMTVGITRAMELGVTCTLCASTGNTSASLAAYSAKAGIRCVVLVPSRKIALGKLSQALIHGAKVLAVKGNFDQALALVRSITERYRNVYLMNSLNPFRVEGQKTIAYEICTQLNYQPPDIVIVPMGNAANIGAIWKGFEEFHRLGIIDSKPKMFGIQAEGAAPIVKAFKENRDSLEPLANPETVATAIRIGNPTSWKKALRAIKNSNGGAETVSDEAILEAQRLLASSEGLFVEPASAASIAGLKKLVEQMGIDRDETIVCIATGSGLKDPQTAIVNAEAPVEVEPDLTVIERLVNS